MSTTEINDIVEYLTKNGLVPEDVENFDGFISLNYDSYFVDIDFNDSGVIVIFTTPLDCRATFNKRCVNFINEFANHWEICKGFLKITFDIKDKQDLVKILKRCVAVFVEQ